MTERKPAGVGFESWVDKQMREATGRGEFRDLPGFGRPLPDSGRPYDEQWWLRDKLRREGESLDALLPTPLRLRKEIHRLPEIVRGLRDERAVRARVADLNQEILDWLRAPAGPNIPIRPVDVEEIVEQWRADRPAEPEPEPEAEVRNPRRRWWRRGR